MPGKAIPRAILHLELVVAIIGFLIAITVTIGVAAIDFGMIIWAEKFNVPLTLFG